MDGAAQFTIHYLWGKGVPRGGWSRVFNDLNLCPEEVYNQCVISSQTMGITLLPKEESIITFTNDLSTGKYGRIEPQTLWDSRAHGVFFNGFHYFMQAYIKVSDMPKEEYEKLMTKSAEEAVLVEVTDDIR